MNNSHRVFAAVALAALALLLAPGTTLGQNMATIALNDAKVLLDNDQVRVLEEHYKPGDNSEMHSHPASVIYAFTSGKFRFTSSDGKVMERDVTADSALYRDPVTHASEWLGPSEGRFLVVELKGSSAKEMPTHETQQCMVRITKPKMGDTVKIREQAKGTATVPPGMFLWIFTHKQGLAKWWPQGGGATTPKGKDGDWVVDVAYGDEQDPKKDASATFEIKAVVVDQKTQDDISNYVADSEGKGTYAGIVLPATTDPGCNDKDDIVVKRK